MASVGNPDMNVVHGECVMFLPKSDVSLHPGYWWILFPQCDAAVERPHADRTGPDYRLPHCLENTKLLYQYHRRSPP